MIDRRNPTVCFLFGDVHMPWWEIVLIAAGTLLCFTVIHFIAKNKHPFTRALVSVAVGLGTLLAVNLSTGLTGVSIPVSLLSVLISAIGGVPGVTLILALNLFF